MDTGLFRLPSTVGTNAYKAYINEHLIQQTVNKCLNAIDLNWESNSPDTLRILVLRSIIQNWHELPILKEIPKQADQNYILENLDVSLPIKILSKYIKENTFWKRCFLSRWKNFIPNVGQKKWISVYMEKDLAEMFENLEPCNYDPEEMQSVLEVAAPYVEELNITCLQPSMEEKVDHIPFDFILSNLTELRKFRISYIAKNVGTNFYLGCSYMSSNDAIFLCQGLQKTYDLLEFCLFSTTIDFTIIKIFAKSLDKGCPNLTKLSLTNCRIGDKGFMQFLRMLNRESFVHLKVLILANNFFSQETTLHLSRAICDRKIEHLDISLNPIGSEGVATIFSVISKLPIKILNVSACSITESIGRLFLRTIIENNTLRELNISNNSLGNELGENIYKIVGFNRTLKHLDLRNTNILTKLRKDINAVLFQNRTKL